MAASSVTTFAYHRSLAPTIGILLALGLVEALVLHLVAAAYWGWKVGMALGIVDLFLFGALIVLLGSFRTRPVTLDGKALVLRTGGRRAIAVNVDDVAGLREHWTAADLKAPGVLNMALGAWPNVVIDLQRPVLRRQRAITTVAHRFDDPAAFRAALLPLIASGRDPMI